MSTTLTEARTALVRLSSQFPAHSTYATLLSILSDYFDNQVPLNIENRGLYQRIDVLNATITRLQASADALHVTVHPPCAPHAQHKANDCISWMGADCECTACRVHSHA